MDDLDSGQQAVVMVAKAECLDCGHLAGPLGSVMHPCIDDDACPARYYRLAVGLPVHRHSADLAKALAEGDAKRVAELASALDGIDPSVAAKVMSLASARLREIA